MIPNRAIVYPALEIRFAYLGIRSANLLAATRSAGEGQPIRSIWNWVTPYFVARCALRYSARFGPPIWGIGRDIVIAVVFGVAAFRSLRPTYGAPFRVALPSPSGVISHRTQAHFVAPPISATTNTWYGLATWLEPILSSVRK